jgi:hypothetical protein
MALAKIPEAEASQPNMLEVKLIPINLYDGMGSSIMIWLPWHRELIMHRCSDDCSASARISKGQGYQGFLRKRAGSSFGQKKGNLRHTRKNLKNGQISLLVGQ